MTKEELEKEAEEKLPQAEVAYCHGFIMSCEPRDLPYSELLRFETGYKRGYLAGAEPREKQIQIDAEQIRVLQKQNGELTDKVKELEAQIEKMKCCANCKWDMSESKMVHPPCKECNWDLDKWEIKENDKKRNT